MINLLFWRAFVDSRLTHAKPVSTFAPEALGVSARWPGSLQALEEKTADARMHSAQEWRITLA